MRLLGLLLIVFGLATLASAWPQDDVDDDDDQTRQTVICQDRALTVTCGSQSVTVNVPPDEDPSCPALTCALPPVRNVVRRRCGQTRKLARRHLRRCVEVVVEAAS